MPLKKYCSIPFMNSMRKRRERNGISILISFLIRIMVDLHFLLVHLSGLKYIFTRQNEPLFAKKAYSFRAFWGIKGYWWKTKFVNTCSICLTHAVTTSSICSSVSVELAAAIKSVGEEIRVKSMVSHSFRVTASFKLACALLSIPINAKRLVVAPKRSIFHW